MARPLQRGGAHGTLHRLHLVHRRVPVPRARVRERRPCATPAGGAGRVQPRRQGVRHLHPCLSQRFREWESEIDELFFGQVRKPEEVIGQYREIYLARATEQECTDARTGRRRRLGAVALGPAQRRDRRGPDVEALGRADQWDAEPTVVTDAEGVLATAGSRYTYSANPLALLKAAEMGLSKVALVGHGLPVERDRCARSPAGEQVADGRSRGRSGCSARSRSRTTA